MKRDQMVVVFLALFIAGYVAGRISARSPSNAVPAPVAAAPATVASAEPNSSPAPAAAPAPAPVSAPVSAPAPAQKAEAPQAPADPNQIWRVTLTPDDAKRGPDSAPVKVVLFSAFGCPECAEFAPVLDQVVKAYGDKVQIRFKHKVIPPPHPDSILASEASMAANAQGKFWQFHDKVMGKGLDRQSLETAAKEVGCDMAKWKSDLDSGKFRGIVLKDSLLANEIAAHSYPNVLVNGIRLRPPKNFESLKALIDERMVDAKKQIAAGTPAAQLHDKIVKDGKFFEQTGGPPVHFDTAGSPMLGPASAKVELELFEDFQCPFCSKLSPSIKEFQKRFPKDVRIVYKQMPLNIHDNAQIAAEASMAAAAQGKFWEYHDVLFNNQQALTRPDLEKYAGQIGLDVAKFKKDLDAGVGKQLISRDSQEGANAGVSGTPSVFINGMRYQGPRGYPPEGLEAVARTYFGLGK